MLKKKSLTTRDALRAAANQDCLEAVRFLVEEGVVKDETDKEGKTPSMLAAQPNYFTNNSFFLVYHQILYL